MRFVIFEKDGLECIGVYNDTLEVIRDFDGGVVIKITDTLHVESQQEIYYLEKEYFDSLSDEDNGCIFDKWYGSNWIIEEVKNIEEEMFG